ncbi:MAG: GTP-dependent dephospho-CoA kinase family protein [Methanomicrobiales archaeon]|nr:GTP-dependent dephospho-CoA kinase family protein [Methanomicrobiales archaeon]MDD1660394.1 GTP-dependent dephospho-CoA kinase family protein [Methanomicrobiales archaeon]
MRRLPEDIRSELKKPFGELYPSLSAILPRLRGHVVYTVGDVVTHHLVRAGVTPDVAIIDGHTMRTPCTRVPSLPCRRIEARNPRGTISDELILAIRDAVAHPPAVIVVEGEEDLAVLPLVLEAPTGALVLYGQPGEGVVLRRVDREARKAARAYLSRFIADGGPGSR